MSALATPCSRFTAATNSTQIVSNEHLHNVEKVDTPAIGNQPATYGILFQYIYPNGATKDVVINFTTSGARNTSFTNWQTANCATVA